MNDPKKRGKMNFRRDRPSQSVPRHDCGHPIPVKHLQGIACQACLKAAKRIKSNRRLGIKVLPDGAKVTIVFLAQRLEYVGQLMLPGGLTFHAVGKGYFGVQSQLWDKLAKHLEEKR